MNRLDLQELANIRIADAMVLQATANNPSGAYYLAGYTLECAIKACIAKNIQAGDWPPKPEDVREMYSHDLQKLIKQAGLADLLTSQRNSNIRFAGHWGIVKEWSEQKRYEKCSQKQADDLIKAITDTPDGVLIWIMQYW